MRGSSPIGERSATTGGWGVVCGPPCIPYRPLKHSLDSLSLSIVVEECKDLIWELRRRFLILVPEEAGIWCKTKFSVKHQGKDIHHPPSTIYKWPLSDLPEATLSPSLSLSITISRNTFLIGRCACEVRTFQSPSVPLLNVISILLHLRVAARSWCRVTTGRSRQLRAPSYARLSPRRACQRWESLH